MKKVLLSISMFALVLCGSGLLYSFSTENEATKEMSLEKENGVVFRRNQFLKNKYGDEIYLYTSGTAVFYEDGTESIRCSYSYENREVHFKDDYGRTAKKGSVVMKRNGIDVQSLNISGSVYYNKN